MTDSQRALAVQMFNGAWDLIDKADRTPDEERQMLTQAAGSRALWEGIGGAEQAVTGDWQVAHVAALLGHASLALDFATAAYERASTSDVPTWLVASTCEGLARAHAAADHDEEKDAWIARAHALLAEVDDAEDRELIESQIKSIP
ncbi:MAG TPA: hypothetical protein VMT88_05905 [Actinomycetes bacterium]|nr:hypothetical protein [Actinomycetes bacterium]